MMHGAYSVKVHFILLFFCDKWDTFLSLHLFLYLPLSFQIATLTMLTKFLYSYFIDLYSFTPHSCFFCHYHSIRVTLGQLNQLFYLRIGTGDGHLWMR